MYLCTCIHIYMYIYKQVSLAIESSDKSNGLLQRRQSQKAGETQKAGEKERDTQTERERHTDRKRHTKEPYTCSQKSPTYRPK